MSLFTKRIYLPGASGSAEFWRPVSSLLDDGAHQRLLAWPGLGNEAPAPTVNGIDNLVDIVEAELDEPAELIAQSMGGLIAVRALLRRPERVRRLVLTAASVGMHARAFSGSDWVPDYRKAYPNSASWVGAPILDVSEELRTIVAPVLLIWGDCDPISPVAVGRHLETLFPNANLRLIPGGDHDVAQTHAPMVAKLIREHLDAERRGD